MSIKIGDKVRFLNDVGGGVVVDFNGAEEVIVEHDSGFSIPFPRCECVVIPSQSAEKRGRPSTINITESSKQQTPSPNEYRVSLAFAPDNVDNLSDSTMKLYLINESSYTLLFNVSSVGDKGACNCLKSGSTPPHEIILIGEFARHKLQLLERVMVQIIANKTFGNYQSQEPINSNINTRAVKLSKRSSFNHSPRLGCEALVIDLTSSSAMMDSADTYAKKIVEPPLAKSPNISTIKSNIKQRRDNPTTPEMVEVDLHIENLLDTTAGMNNCDILEYQLEYFRSTISQYCRYRGLKLIFIHGKGDGVLRQSIIKELKRMGRGDRYQEASFKRYGHGALMVVI